MEIYVLPVVLGKLHSAEFVNSCDGLEHGEISPLSGVSVVNNAVLEKMLDVVVCFQFTPTVHAFASERFYGRFVETEDRSQNMVDDVRRRWGQHDLSKRAKSGAANRPVVDVR